MSFRDDILSSHNQYRQKHGARPLTWCNDLASGATKWAQHLANINRLEHDKSNDAGENIAMAGGKELTGSGATQMWYDEIKDYDFNQPAKYNPQCGHFTQVVWAASTKLGAGLAKTKSGNTYVVARYNPAGNMMSRFDGNVLPAGSRVAGDTKSPPNKAQTSTTSRQDIEMRQPVSGTRKQVDVVDGVGGLPIATIFQFILAVAALALLIAATVGEAWSKNDVVTSGLWESSYATYNDEIKATRSFCILAVISVVISLVLLVAKARSPNKVKYIFPAFTLVLAFIFGVIGASVYAATFSDVTFGWSFALAWTGTVFALIACVFVVALK